ncbi:MAG TPA: T9SS type A sorting domain-containing protein [Flavobacterium sp.]
MIKKYSFILFFLFAFSAAVSAQEGLGFYPNPVSNGKIYITSKSALDKEVTIFDVLGKKVLQTITSSKEVNITALSPGVYIIKIREGEATATRKLIVK